MNMEENDLFFYAIQEILSFHQNNNENFILHQSLYEKNPIKHVISEKVKNELQICKYKDASNKDNCKSCCITQDDFLDDDDIIQLPCEHCFFPEPIMKWLTEESSACPVCKNSLESVELKKETDELFSNNNYNNTFFDNDSLFANDTLLETEEMFINNPFFNTMIANAGLDQYIFLEEDDESEKEKENESEKEKDECDSNIDIDIDLDVD